jgi:hypothetical protein
MTKEETYKQFTDDMTDAGYKVRPYRGRFFYDGPAIICPREEFEIVQDLTKVSLCHDDMGKTDIVVYPR